MKCNQLICWNTDGRTIGEDVSVQINQAGRDDPSCGTQNAQRLIRWDVRLDGLYHTEADTDISLSAEVLAGVKDVPALHHEIELVVRTHRSMSKACEARACPYR